MKLPGRLRADVEAALGSSDRPATIVSADGVGGGCVSPVARITLEKGDRFFLKWAGPAHPPGLLAAEARGLELLRRTGTVRVPEVVATPSAGDEWLLLEWIDAGRASPASWRALGEELAALHACRGDVFGGAEDNYIGPLPQSNVARTDWAEFWRENRLRPQLERALDTGALDTGDARRFDALFGVLDSTIGVGDQEGPSVVHGDLWNGNVHMAADGAPAVIDPSAYHGHREVDLAMADLFGGFGSGFREAYESSWPLEPGYPVRRAVYQLYYLLVHVNLFGAGYVSGCRNALQDAGV